MWSFYRALSATFTQEYDSNIIIIGHFFLQKGLSASIETIIVSITVNVIILKAQHHSLHREMNMHAR